MCVQGRNARKYPVSVHCGELKRLGRSVWLARWSQSKSIEDRQAQARHERCGEPAKSLFGRDANIPMMVVFPLLPL